MTSQGLKKARKALKRGKDQQVHKINSILTSAFSTLGLVPKIKEYRVKKLWAECLGKGLAGKTSPIRLIGTTLYCAVASSPWMTELNYQKQSIIDRLNEKHGEGTVTEIIFRIGKVSSPSAPHISRGPQRELTPEEKNFIEKTSEPVKDEKLKGLIQRVIEKSKTY